MEYLSNSFLTLILRHHKPLFLISLLLSLLAIMLVGRIELKTDMLDVLPSKEPRIKQFREFLDDFGSSDNLIVVVESLDGDVLDNMDAVEELAGRLKKSSAILRVEYNAIEGDYSHLIENFPLFLNTGGIEALKERLTAEGIDKQLRKNRELLLSPLSSPLDVELISRDPLNIRSIMLGSLPRKGPSTTTGYYMSSDNRFLLMIVKPARPARDMRFIADFTREVERIKASIERGFVRAVRIGFTGHYAFAMEAQASLKRELTTSFIFSSLFVIFLFQVVYRKRVLVLLLTATTLFAALSCTLAVAYLLFGGLNLVSSIVAITLIPMGIDYIIHIFNCWEDEYQRGGNPGKALEVTFKRVLPGVALGALTTSVAFLSIIVTDFKGLHEFGIIAGIGVMFCLLATILLMGSALIWFAPFLLSPAKRWRGMSGLTNAVIKRRGVVVSTAVVVFVVSLLWIPSVRFNSDPETLGIRDSPAISLQKRVADIFLKSGAPLIAVVHDDDDEGLIARYDAMEESLESLEEEGTIKGYSSLRFFLPSPSRQTASIKILTELRSSASRLKENFVQGLRTHGFTVNSYMEEYIERLDRVINLREPVGLDALSKMGSDKTEMFYNRERHRIAAYLYPPEGKWNDASITRVSSRLAAIGPGLTITGAPIMLRELKGAIIEDSIVAALITFAIISFLVYLHFRSVRWTAVIIGSITCIFIFTIGLMGLFGIPFNYINIGVIALIFGIGVDYSIYIVQGYLQERKEPDEGLARTSKSILMCALTTMAGFGTLMAMSFRGIASFGEILTLGLLVCLASTLVFLPAVIATMEFKGG
ncbi:MAG: RND family transporter [Thermodesulfobacteriota bacterium]